MSYTLLSEKTRTARKQHRCIWCGEAINAGEQYLDERSIYEGNFQYHRWHHECLDDARDGGGLDDGEFMPYSNERPVDQLEAAS